MELTHLLIDALFALLFPLQLQIQSLNPLMKLCFLLYRQSYTEGSSYLTY